MAWSLEFMDCIISNRVFVFCGFRAVHNGLRETLGATILLAGYFPSSATIGAVWQSLPALE
jgi:hypothetical protein